MLTTKAIQFMNLTGFINHRLFQWHGNPGKSLLFLLFLITTLISHAQTFSTNRTPVGLEHNILFHSDQRASTIQTGSESFHLDALFDGSMAVCYTPGAPDPSDPIVIEIKELPNKHIQAGAWVGWSTRGRPAKRFKIEGYNVYQGSNTWVTFADYSTTDNIWEYSHITKIPIQGSYTELRFTFYESHTVDGRIGLSELFFIHPEATTPYEGLINAATSSNVDGIWTESNSEVSYMGNVGIGTSSPVTKLDVNGGSRFRNNMRIDGEIKVGESNKIKILKYENGVVQGISKAFEIGYGEIRSPGSENLLLSWGNTLTLGGTHHANDYGKIYIPGAKVGIGTISPNATLDVSRGTATGGTVQFRGTNRSSHFNFSSAENTYIRGGKANSHVFINDNGGYVGIGTINPTQKLSVAGSINAEEIILEDVQGADFVFEEDYDLRSLAETEQFIKANKHLPEIPSAAEMAEEGLEIKVMNIRLLQKIEELTLHMIRMEKEAKRNKDELTAKLLQQEKEIEALKAAQNNH